MIIPKIKKIIKNDFHTDIANISLLHLGINSHIFKLVSTKHDLFKIKYYHEKEHDYHDSISTEYYSLLNLWQHGIRNINRPVAIYPKERIAVFQYIPGIPITQSSVEKKDIDRLIDFMHLLSNLSKKNISSKFSPAKDACFSMADYIDNCDNKLRLIKNTKKQNGFYFLIDTYLKYEFIPFFRVIKKRIENEYSERNIDVQKPISTDLKILSPSDFGFNNCLRGDSKLYFIDFEYFGWDDPAKLIVDSMIRPEGNIPVHLQQYFCEKSISLFSYDKTLQIRVRMLYFLLACKWCMILLNAWIAKNTYYQQEKYLTQLRKSQNLLQKIKKMLEMKNSLNLPYEINVS
jgi:thiamine kinase-like enzyme